MPFLLEGSTGSLSLEGGGLLLLEGETSSGVPTFYSGEPTSRRWHAHHTHPRWTVRDEVCMQFRPTPHTSLQYQGVDIEAKEAGILVDPTGDTVKLAFISTGELPADSDFKTAFWETDTTTNPNRPIYTALCLVGPGGTIELATGTYRVYCKITDSPEVPILGPIPGVLQIT